ncbi:MAG: radical SAM protein [Candidatus Methanofastidiosia archaeon]|jgi:radical SAM protein with 4Fe4S-binding SPASM domain
MIEPELKTVYWTVTTGCNQRCKHCWLSAGVKKGNELTAEQWIKVFDKIIDMGLKDVKITGGEPLLRWPDIKNVFHFLADNKIHLRLETNGTLLCGKYNQEILDVFKGEYMASISVSLDSHIPEEHDEFRSMKGAFEKTIKGVSLLKENEIPFSIVSVLHSKNCDQIMDMVAFVEDIGPKIHQINLIMPQGRANNNTDLTLSMGFYRKLPSLIKRVRKEMKKKVSFNIPYIFAPLDINFLMCNVGKSICGLLPNGDIAVCGAGVNRRDLTLGNCLTDDIEDVWMNSSVFKTLRKDFFDIKGICGNCLFVKYCHGYCRAYAFSVYGKLDASYPVCQILYEQGAFPEKYMIDPDRDCSYGELPGMDD